jgi:proline dehydrogenase
MTERIPARMVLAFARRYVAGPSVEHALRRADALWSERHIHSTLDVLGEHVSTPEQARAALAGYQEAARRIASRRWVSLSIKPGHFGHYVDPTLCETQVRALAAQAQTQGTRLTIDMEDVDLTDATLALYRRLKPGFPELGTVLQTKLFRTARDIEDLAGHGARVRICLGVYDVPAELGFTRKAEAKENLLRLLPRLLDTADVVEIATHDRRVIARAREILAEKRVPRERIEFQMLLGVPRAELQADLVADGWTVRVYVPYADSWSAAVAYLRRRLAESPSMALLVARNLFGRGYGGSSGAMLGTNHQAISSRSATVQTHTIATRPSRSSVALPAQPTSPALPARAVVFGSGSTATPYPSSRHASKVQSEPSRCVHSAATVPSPGTR